MELIDHVFLTVFARYRRKIGDHSVNSAWIRAVSKVSGFLLLPTAAVTFLLVISANLVTGSGTPAEHMRWGKISTIIAWLCVAFLLQARFTKYLRDPPVLAPQESTKDRRIVWWFRVVSISVFLMMCVTAFALHEAGLGPRVGF